MSLFSVFGLILEDKNKACSLPVDLEQFASESLHLIRLTARLVYHTFFFCFNNSDF